MHDHHKISSGKPTLPPYAEASPGVVLLLIVLVVVVLATGLHFLLAATGEQPGCP